MFPLNGNLSGGVISNFTATSVDRLFLAMIFIFCRVFSFSLNTMAAVRTKFASQESKVMYTHETIQETLNKQTQRLYNGAVG